jgi:hypothetical protein
VFGDWEQPYLTLDPKYEAAQLRVFAKLVAAGHIYRGRKPVHWSPSSATALAEAELEYPEGHTSRSIYVAMPLVSLGARAPTPTMLCQGTASPHQSRNQMRQWLGLGRWTGFWEMSTHTMDALRYHVQGIGFFLQQSMFT